MTMLQDIALTQSWMCDKYRDEWHTDVSVVRDDEKIEIILSESSNVRRLVYVATCTKWINIW